MSAPTASQMLRDDKRLRNLHRENAKRRKRFLAKQKQIEDEEANRRIHALQNRKKRRNKHLSSFRKNKNQPIRVEPKQINKTDTKHNAENFMVPVCDQLPSPTLLASNRSIRPKKRIRKVAKNGKKKTNVNQFCEKKIEFEENENETEQFDDFQDTMSDQRSVAELDDFEIKHFGIDRSIQYNKKNNHQKMNKENIYKTDINSDCPIIKRKSNGYQQIFHKKMDYGKEKECNRPVLKSLSNFNNNINPISSIQSNAMFSINDIDMKQPEDNDSVKINPNDSIDCSKMSFSTVYNSNLLPLQSVKSQLLPLNEIKENQYPKTRKVKAIKDYHPKFKRTRTNISCNSHQLPYKYQKINRSVHQNDDTKSAVNVSYGIKLPRLTQSILKEKDRIDSRQQQQQRSPRSNYSAPVWNRYLSKDNGFNHPINPRRNAMTIIDSFFNKENDDFLHSNRQSNTTMFLPNINRSKLKPKVKKPSYSVISDYDLMREEDKLQKSLLKLNETLGNLSVKEGHYYESSKPKERKRRYSKQRKYSNYMNETKVSNIPRKLKVRKAPTLRSKRRRGRWNI